MGHTLLLLGASGAVGQQVLRLALDDPRLERVIAPTRRALAPHPKLDNPVTDFRSPATWQADAVVCALGTTIRQAGSQAAFAAIDRDLVVSLARAARARGARSFALNSSLGATPNGNFYLRTKAQAEQGLRELGFPRLALVRPSLIDTARTESRPGERIGLFIGRCLGPLLPARYRPVSAEAIARCLLEQALAPEAGEFIVESEAISR